MHIHTGRRRGDNPPMDIKEIRKRNLRLLISKIGSTRLLAEMAETNPDWLSALASDNPPLDPKGNPRGMGSRLARKLEAGTGLRRGWMDTLHGEGEAREMVLTLFSALSEENQGKVVELMRLLKEVQDLTTPPPDHVKSQKDQPPKGVPKKP